MISNEKGEDKKLMQKWPMEDNKLNFFFATTDFGESANITTYIINGKPTD